MMKNSMHSYEEKMRVTQAPMLLFLSCAVITAGLSIYYDNDVGVIGFLLLTFFVLGFVVLLLSRNKWRRAMHKHNNKNEDDAFSDGELFDIGKKRDSEGCFSQKAKNGIQIEGDHICKAFEMTDRNEQFKHLKNVKKIENFGDFCNGHYLHTWDDGHRILSKCPECNAYILIQVSEYHGSDDSYYIDYFPVASREAALALKAGRLKENIREIRYYLLYKRNQSI